MGQADTVPGANATEKVPAEQRDAVTTDHTIQNPAQAPGNTAGIRSTGINPNQAIRDQEARDKAAQDQASKEGGESSSDKK